MGFLLCNKSTVSYRKKNPYENNPRVMPGGYAFGLCRRLCRGVVRRVVRVMLLREKGYAQNWAQGCLHNPRLA